MGKKDSRIDLYITKAKPFAQPILNHLRDLVHKSCPDIEETVKWGMPSFDYKGPFCSMAAFKEHAVFGFWKASLMKDAEKLKDNQQSAMGHAGKIKSLKDLPSDKTLISWIKEAAKLNDDGIKHPPRKKTEKKDLIIPDYFTKALGKNKRALLAFEKFPPSHKKEYVEWITEAKTEDTRSQRMETALEWIAEGKGRNWKYERK
ncbi:MAG: YdeI/OmpD-associated family protein [Chitinophagaceae bacterium]|nr:YdeI/OmpD-associated family protein [Chitinophagaceae bacterium]